LLGISASLSCQTSNSAQQSASQNEVVSVSSLGFRYTPPTGLTDKTSPMNKELRERADSYTTKAAQLLLDMSSNDSDSSGAWHQIWLFIFPRTELANLSDATAERKMNTALAGPHASPAGETAQITISGHRFLVSEFEQREPPLVKQAKIYTTICKTQLVSFVFVTNSAAPMKDLEESLKTLTFSSN
jgi:hypothetical protein